MKTSSSAPKGKEKSEKAGSFAKGGSTKMFGKSGSAPDVPGSAAMPSLPRFDKAPLKGGKTGVMGKQRGAAPSVPGQVSSGGRGGDNSFKVSGGRGRMAGFSPSSPAKPR
jgi:hypothetical protein